MTKEHSVIRDSFSGSSNTTKTYDRDMNYISIKNDGSSDLTLTVGVINITVKSDEELSAYFTPFTSFSIVATDSFRCLVGGP